MSESQSGFLSVVGGLLAAFGSGLLAEGRFWLRWGFWGGVLGGLAGGVAGAWFVGGTGFLYGLAGGFVVGALAAMLLYLSLVAEM